MPDALVREAVLETSEHRVELLGHRRAEVHLTTTVTEANRHIEHGKRPCPSSTFEG